MAVSKIKFRSLVELREYKGLSQQSLAERARVSRSTVSMIECGLRDPSMSTIRLLAIGLRVEPSMVLDALSS